MSYKYLSLYFYKKDLNLHDLVLIKLPFLVKLSIGFVWDESSFSSQQLLRCSVLDL